MISDSIAKITVATIVTLSAQLTLPLKQHALASREISLENRYEVKSVSDVFKDNILLNLAYMRGTVSLGQNIQWDEVKKPFQYEFKLDSSKTFAFHDDVLDEYKDKVTQTTKAHFNSQEGFKTDGYLFGDGVCHLASLIYWVAKDAGLDANAPVNHDFMSIPEISREYGVSIYNHPNNKAKGQRQNLYITNNKEKAVTFKFEYDGVNLKVSVLN